jgi:flagellar protein FlgJ
VDPDLLLSQAALETGWGRSIMRHPDGQSTHNLFGIKADPSWEGDRVVQSTLEYIGGRLVRTRAAFRAYGSFAESFEDYASFLKGQPRYARALEHAGDPGAFMRGLQEAGYATDPSYAEKVLRIWTDRLPGRLKLSAAAPLKPQR